MAIEIAPSFQLMGSMRTLCMVLQDLLRLYERGMQGRDIRGNKAVKVDARVEEEWDSIYVECQDDSGAGRKGTETANAKLRRNAMRDAVRSERAVGEAYASPSDPGTESRGPTSEVLFLGDFMDGLGEEMDGKGVMQGAETEDGDQGEMKGSSERQGNARDTDPDEGDDIIDCAIRGRWSFTDNDDQVRRSPADCRFSVHELLRVCIGVWDNWIASWMVRRRSQGFMLGLLGEVHP